MPLLVSSVAGNIFMVDMHRGQFRESREIGLAPIYRGLSRAKKKKDLITVNFMLHLLPQFLPFWKRDFTLDFPHDHHFFQCKVVRSLVSQQQQVDHLSFLP
jgi:hypothetical protein